MVLIDHLKSYMKHKITKKCEVCNSLFKNMEELKVHKLSNHPEFPKKYLCSFCPSHYSRKVYLRKHISNEHSERLRCGLCHEHCSDAYSMMRHYMV